MPRTKSTPLARIKDLAGLIIDEINKIQDEYQYLLDNSEKLKQIEPYINRLVNSMASTPKDYETTPHGPQGPDLGPEPEPSKRKRRIKSMLKDEINQNKQNETTQPDQNSQI